MGSELSLLENVPALAAIIKIPMGNSYLLVEIGFRLVELYLGGVDYEAGLAAPICSAFPVELFVMRLDCLRRFALPRKPRPTGGADLFFRLRCRASSGISFGAWIAFGDPMPLCITQRPHNRFAVVAF